MADDDNKPDGQTPSPDNDNTQTPADDGAGEQFNLIDAVDAAYERIDEQGNVTAEPQPEPEPAGTGAESDDVVPEGDDQTTTVDEPGEGETGTIESIAGETATVLWGDGSKTQVPVAELELAEKARDGADDPDLELTAEEREQLGERATQRFEKLVERVKTEAEEKQQIIAERDTYREQHESLANVLRDTNASTEQLSEILDLTTELVSGDPARGQRAVERAYAMVRDYARHYGVSLPQASLLDNYPDLQQKVEDGSMTQEAAEENARLRSTQASYEAQRNRDAQASAQQSQVQQAANQALADITQLENDWRTKDADWGQKEALMRDYAARLAQGIMAGQVHPSQVPNLMRDKYDTITQTMKTVAATMRDNKPPEPNPLRPGATRSAGTETPRYKSVAEAVEAEYAKM